jgi:hypothetical protein
MLTFKKLPEDKLKAKIYIDSQRPIKIEVLIINFFCDWFKKVVNK